MAAVSGGGGDMAPSSELVPVKSRRVRTGCLTCRERHLKCDEGTPDCLNCRKSNRECKRGVRLNFIDMNCKKPPYIPPVEEWSVQFHDESRLIASEYRGGLGRYAKLEQETIALPKDAADTDSHVLLRRQSMTVGSTETQGPIDRRTSSATLTPQPIYYTDRGQLNQHESYGDGLHSRKNSDASFMAPPGSSHSNRYDSMLTEPYMSLKNNEESRCLSQQAYKSNDVSPLSAAAETPVGPPSTYRGGQGNGNADTSNGPDLGGMITPPNDKSGEREYLNSPEELHFMQVYVSEVGIWMDSLDKDKHFSRLVPYHALKCPMLLNALLACGVKHLTLTQQYNDDKALFYYDTATTQLLRSLQNPERNTAECATTAVVLNVYEIMSEKPTQRMSHIAGARALIRECGWNAKSTGLGAACFWLNVGMELLSCLAFNWQTAWDPDQWGVDMDFNTDKEQGREEIWVHRIFHIVAKICNFRASIPKFQEPSPHDEQIRLQARYAEWQRLKSLCDEWNNSCPRPMHPFGYLYPSQSQAGKSLFPNVWLIKRAAVVGRLFYHTAQCLLAQINPFQPNDSDEAKAVMQHHAHQVCGIVAHTNDRGVASVSIRSVAIVAEILTARDQQDEVVSILENIQKHSGWKLAGVVKLLRKSWGRDQMTVPSLAQQFLPATSESSHPSSKTASPSGGMMPSAFAQAQSQSQAQTQTQTQTQAHRLSSVGQGQGQGQGQGVLQHQSSTVVAPRPMRSVNVNPLSFADFSLPNHPYQNWYEPPSRSNNYNSSQGFL